TGHGRERSTVGQATLAPGGRGQSGTEPARPAANCANCQTAAAWSSPCTLAQRGPYRAVARWLEGRPDGTSPVVAPAVVRVVVLDVGVQQYQGVAGDRPQRLAGLGPALVAFRLRPAPDLLDQEPPDAGQHQRGR